MPGSEAGCQMPGGRGQRSRTTLLYTRPNTFHSISTFRALLPGPSFSLFPSCWSFGRTVGWNLAGAGAGRLWGVERGFIYISSPPGVRQEG